MFKMNPHAKEFIPAHILRKRKEQEEADRLANDIGKVNINSDNGTENGEEKKLINTDNSTSETQNTKDAVKTTSTEQTTTTSMNQKKLSNTKNADPNSGENLNQNLPDDFYYPDEDEYGDDELYLASGENICEFNGEQFIIPVDDNELETPRNVAYDFGNDEDNEDEEVRKAFEEFLGDLPQ